jgi:BirA family biotin operon repressor/biotin-[acetyl-CoA-carboxylase] ligase
VALTYDGLDARALAALTRAPHVELRDAVTSTQDLAHELGASGAPAGTLVLAEEQTSGRGRQGRQWRSPRGGGVWLTVLLRPGAAHTRGVLALRAGLATVRALAEAAHELAPRLKWPNDVIVAGRKAGGILCEARWSADTVGWVAAGVGINVRGPAPADVRQTAIALSDVAPAISRLAVLAALVPRLTAAGDGPAELTGTEQAAFLDLAWAGPGEMRPAGLAPDGALLVERLDGSLERRVDAP